MSSGALNKEERRAVEGAMPVSAEREQRTEEEARAEARRARDAEDRAWIAEALDGDRAAYGRLVERYQERVYGVCYGILQNRDDAWDAAQEVFVKVYKSLHRFDGSAAFYTWLYRVSHNLAIDHYRSKRRRRAVDIEDNRKLENVMAEHRPQVEGDPAHQSQRRELHELLHRAMDQLSEKHRAIIVLREVEGLSYEELAEVLGINKGTVMSRLFHARKNLQALLGPYVESGADVPPSLKAAREGAA